MIYTVDKRFHTEVQRTPRVLEIAEAFGLGLDDKEFVVFDNQPIEIEQGDVVYVTGQSGAGKSTVLRELAAQMTQQGLSVVDIDKVPLLDAPLIDQIGKTTQEALNFLAIAGINAAYLYIRKPTKLSDGQRYHNHQTKNNKTNTKDKTADKNQTKQEHTTTKEIAFN